MVSTETAIKIIDLTKIMFRFRIRIWFRLGSLPAAIEYFSRIASPPNERNFCWLIPETANYAAFAQKVDFQMLPIPTRTARLFVKLVTGCLCSRCFDKKAGLRMTERRAILVACFIRAGQSCSKYLRVDCHK